MCAQRSERISAVTVTGPDLRLAFVEPMVPSLVDKPPKGDQWFHEIKYDGYRSQIAIAGKEVRVYTRNGYDWTKKNWQIADAALDLVGRDVRIDGEIIVQDEAGKPNFSSLRSSITATGHRLVFYAFDLLSLDGEDLRRRPCEERRAMLGTLLASVRPADPPFQPGVRRIRRGVLRGPGQTRPRGDGLQAAIELLSIGPDNRLGEGKDLHDR